MRHLLLFICLVLISFNVLAEYHRSQKAKNIFKYEHPCPSTGRVKGACQGYIIDHIKPIACGGADDAGNMKWQTTKEAKAKDKWERQAC